MEGLEPHVLIRTLRRELKMTQAQLARRAGLPQSHLAKIEGGKVDMQLGTLRRILRAMSHELVLTLRLLKGPEQRERWPVRILDREDPRDDLRFWLAKSPAERIAAVEFLRRQCLLVTGQKNFPRLTHSFQLRER